MCNFNFRQSQSMGLYFVVLIRRIIMFWGQVSGRVQNQPDPEWGALSELLQQDLCRLGLLHHQPQHGGPEAQQPAVRAPSECCWVFSRWVPCQQGHVLRGGVAACREARWGPGCPQCLAGFSQVVFKSFCREHLPGVDHLMPKHEPSELRLGRKVGTQ